MRGYLGLVSLAPALLVLSLLGPATGCTPQGPKAALDYGEDAKRAYELAMEEFRAHNWIECQSMFREVKKNYAYSKYARLAELRIADADFEQDKFAEAVRQYRDFTANHRADNEGVAYARARTAEAQYLQAGGDGIFAAPSDERDQAVILDAYRELRNYLGDYPNAGASDRARELLGNVTARLIQHELVVARFYLNRDNYEATVARIKYALRTYGSVGASSDPLIVDSGLEPECLLLLGETYLRMERWSDARDAFVTLLRDYSASSLTDPARRFLKYMESRGV